jgi:hypothetical protein
MDAEAVVASLRSVQLRQLVETIPPTATLAWTT